MVLLLLPESAPSVHETRHHADVDADAVEPREDVIAPDEHSNVSYAHIFQASDDGGRQRRVVLCTED